jgi:hypothetical protein
VLLSAAGTNPTDTVAADRLYFRMSGYNSLWSSPKVQNPTPVQVPPTFTFQYGTTVPGMDPAGENLCEVYNTVLRAFNTTDGSFRDWQLYTVYGNGPCGSRNDTVYVPMSRSVYKVTPTGTILGRNILSTGSGNTNFSVVNDTIWTNNDTYSKLYGYACSRITGDNSTLVPGDSWDLGPGGSFLGISIAFDGTYYYAVWCGTPPRSVFKRFNRNRTLYDSGSVAGNVYGVMARNGAGSSRDVQTLAIIAPTGTVNQGAVIAPQAIVRNNSSAAQSFSVKFTIQGGYADSASVANLGAGASDTVTLASWTAAGLGSLVTSCSTRLAGDANPTNDKVTGTVFVQNLDAQVVSIVAPTGTVNQFTVIAPQASVRNNGNSTQLIPVKLMIQGGYADSTSISIAAGATQTVTFANWTADPPGTLAVRCTTSLAGDMVPTNNAASGAVTVQAVSVDAQTVSIDAPVGTVDTGQTVVPAVTVRNNSTTGQTFSVKFNIAPAYADSQSVTLAAGASRSVTFANWIAAVPGALSVKCSTRLAGDANPANDRLTGTVFVAVPDIGASAIVAPRDTVAPGPTYPQAQVRNYGNVRRACRVLFRISGAGSYLDSVVLAAGLPFADTVLFFPAWTAVSGSYTTRCSTFMTGDRVAGNNVASSAFAVGVNDAGVQAILFPTGSLDSTVVIVPTGNVKNFGTVTVTFKTFFVIRNSLAVTVYRDSQVVSSLAPGGSANVAFNTWAMPHPKDSYTERCSVSLAWDANPGNDRLADSFRIAGTAAGNGWIRRADIPVGGRNKAVKDGGSLASAGRSDSAFIYALKGNGTCEFYRYNAASNTWEAKESIPAFGSSGKKKAVKKGAALAGTDDAVYAFKGNGTLEFWSYVPGHAPYPWVQLADVPAGTRMVKQGSGAVVAQTGDTTYLYFLKGSGTNEFYRYNAQSGVWQSLAGVPVGTSGKAFKTGSSLTGDGRDSLYALKGSYNEFFAYSVSSDLWTTRAGLPLIGSSGRKKKARDGAGLGRANGLAYALKGGNTREYFVYDPALDKWTQKEDMPTGGGKNVKNGGALTGAGDVLFAMKGNRTLEFYEYVPASAVNSEQVAGSSAQTGGTLPALPLRLDVTPTVFRNPQSAVRITYTLPQTGAYILRLYDITGKLSSTLVSGNRSAGSYTVTTPNLARGIYVLKLTTSNTTTTAKLIVE